MRILWLSWRDIRNLDAGGAEVFTYEVTKRLIASYKHDVTLFASGFHGGSEQEVIDGVNVLRRGGRFSVYSKAKQYYLQDWNQYDLIIDEINVRPFLTPKFVKEKPIVGLIHQTPRRALFYELSFPISYFMYYSFVKRWLNNSQTIAQE